MEAELEELLREDAPTDVGKISSILAEMKRLQSLHIAAGGNSDYGLPDAVAPGYQPPSDVYQPNGTLYDAGLGGGSLHY